MRTLTEPVRLAQPIEEFTFSRTFIKATAEPADSDPFTLFADRIRHHPAWGYREIATNHMIPENRPAELAAALRQIAAS